MGLEMLFDTIGLKQKIVTVSGSKFKWFISKQTKKQPQQQGNIHILVCIYVSYPKCLPLHRCM